MRNKEKLVLDLAKERAQSNRPWTQRRLAEALRSAGTRHPRKEHGDIRGESEKETRQ
jgi:hypothetical protein